jgi:hypothetical protein
LNAVSPTPVGECGLSVTDFHGFDDLLGTAVAEVGDYSRPDRLYQAFAELGRKYAARVVHMVSWRISA